MKKNIIDAKDDFVELINRQKKFSAVILGVIVLFIISLFFFIPKMQANIRASEINYLIERINLDKKVSFFYEDDIEKQIDNKKAITVLFSEPYGSEYDKVLTAFSDTKLMNSFNHSLFIYPIVYNSSNIEKKFEIKKNEVTVIFFENGTEKNRLIVDASLDIKTMLIPKLNELPLSADIPQVQPSQTTASSSQEQTETSTTATSEEDIAPVESSEVLGE